ncbi:hypothetical protein [Nocardiopsis synnemataformans]|uniref:hypothetical protein n=1 Tax=Nocardiopsis synnemataformans TaxID=61305 RepID=UPI003EBE9790
MNNHTRATDPQFTHQVTDPSGRGFHGYLQFLDLYGSRITVKPSSLADESAVWIFAKSEEEEPAGRSSSAVHMGFDHAMELTAALARWAADNQIDSEGLYDHEEVHRRAARIAEDAQWIKANTVWGEDLGAPDDD